MTQPRGLNLKQSAAYVGVCPDTFRAWVKAGEMPTPRWAKGQGRRRHLLWDRDKLDEWFSGGKGEQNEVDAYMEAAHREQDKAAGNARAA